MKIDDYEWRHVDQEEDNKISSAAMALLDLLPKGPDGKVDVDNVGYFIRDAIGKATKPLDPGDVVATVAPAIIQKLMQAKSDRGMTMSSRAIISCLLAFDVPEKLIKLFDQLQTKSGGN